MDEDICEYFDSFGLSIPTEVEEYLMKIGKFCSILLMRFKKGQVFYADTGVFIISSRGRMTKVVLKFFTSKSLTNNQMVNYEFMKRRFNIQDF